MKHLLLNVLCLVAPLAVHAETCPPAKDVTSDIAMLLNDVRDAPDERSAAAISNKMWQLWTIAPDALAQDYLDNGMTRRSQFDFAGAEAAFTALIEYCPNYAEGWNQRAFVNFLREDYPKALVDLDKALELNPVHVAALSGKALTLLFMGEEAQGQKVLREALALNPWLSERAYLRDVPRDDL